MLKNSTFWTYSDKSIQDISIYASNNLGNYQRFGDEMFLDFYYQCIDMIQCLKCYDVQFSLGAETFRAICDKLQGLYHARIQLHCPSIFRNQVTNHS